MSLTCKPQDFIERSNVRGFLTLFLDWGAIAVIISINIWLNNLVVYLASVWAIGSFQFSIGEVLFHEASHNNLFKTKKLNDYLEFLYALPFFVDMNQYRNYHIKHHNKLNSEEDHLVEDYELHGLNKAGKNLFWIWFVKPVLGYAGYFYLRFVIELNPRKSAAKFLIFWTPIIVTCLYFNVFHLLVLYWFVPFLWSFASFYYWSEIGEHYNTKSGTRSDIASLKNFFHHNAGYHYIHHQYPSIPWYNLHKAHDALCQKDTDIANGFFDTYNQMKKSRL